MLFRSQDGGHPWEISDQKNVWPEASCVGDSCSVPYSGCLVVAKVCSVCENSLICMLKCIFSIFPVLCFSMFLKCWQEVRMATIQKSISNKYWRGCKEKGTLLRCWWECKLVQPLWRTVWRFLKKLEIELPYDPAIPLLGIHTEETRSERDTCTPVFITALFIIARTL